MLLLVVEGTWIALAAVRVLATLLFDRLLRLVGKGGVIPASIACLEDAADMSALLGSVVLRSRSDAEKFALSEAKALGAGGTGTNATSAEPMPQTYFTRLRHTIVSASRKTIAP